MATKKFPYTTDPSLIPTKKVLFVDGESKGSVAYACPKRVWSEHLEEWRRAYRNGNKTAPQPMPVGHLMFSTPASYGAVPYGSTDPTKVRKAVENCVRAELDGWDKFVTDQLPPEEAKARIEQIVQWTVEKRMAGKDTGTMPYLACIYSGLSQP